MLARLTLLWTIFLLPPWLESARGGSIDFSRQVLPILSDKCFECHGPDANHRKGALRLDTQEGAYSVGRGGRPAVVPNQPEQSELVRRIRALDPDDVMPPSDSNRKLSPDQRAVLARWVEQGAPWGRHWAFDPPRRADLPAIADPSWPRKPVDYYILARLEHEGLRPSPSADPGTLLRRVTLDLTGLPPSLEEMDAFGADPSPAAYEAAVERLLASPAFGERMAWDWMEAARYADSNGYQGDNDRTMWPWRDWVVEAINSNLPYDQFTLWQLAGDLLPEPSFEQVLATGFSRNHPINGEGGRIPEENRVEYVMDMSETAGTVWLGLTFNCARCHDHKFDPITRREYYSLFAFFNQTPVDGGGGNPQTPPVAEVMTAADKITRTELREAARAAAAELEEVERMLFPSGAASGSSPRLEGVGDAIRKILDTSPAKRGVDQLKELESAFKDSEYARQARALRKSVEARNNFEGRVPRVMVMADRETLRPTFMLDKGLYNKPGEEVTASMPEHLPGLPESLPRTRLGLAKWMTSPDHPLTARVTVNRVWQMLFGAGLVRTPEDFGLQGQFPTHPELLDWLAVELIDSGWDVKHLVQLLVTSATYRQDSRLTPALLELDPDNRWLARASRHRLPSWMIRDQALAAAGLLVHQVGGPPVKPYQPDGVWAEATFGNKRYRQDSGASLYRRSLYTFWRRIVGPTLFFDTPSRSVCAVKPTRTNTPLHALATLNDVTYVEAARALALRVIRHASTTDERLRLASRLVLARAPTSQEASVLLRGLERAQTEFEADPTAAAKLLAVGESEAVSESPAEEHAAWTTLCLTLLNLDEALNKE